MFDIVTVPNFLVEDLSDRQLADLEFYFSPDVYLIPEASDPGVPRTLADATGTQVLAPRLLSDPVPYYYDDEVLLVIPYLDALADLRGAAFDKPVHLITGFLSQEYDFSSFSSSIANIDAYHNVVTTIDAPSLTHFTLEVPAGDTVTADVFDSQIKGLNWVEGGTQNPTRYIPRIEINPSGETLVEHLRSDRLGLQAIYQLGAKYRDRLKAHGFETRADLIENDVSELLQVPGVGGYNAAVFIAGAHAIQDETTYRFDEVPYTDQHKVFLDIETDSLDPNIIWQIGLYDDAADEYGVLLQTDPSDPGDIIHAFGEWLIKTDADVLLAWNGGDFDYPHLEAFLDEYGTEEYMAAWESITKADMKQDVVQQCAGVPTRTWSLSAMATQMGYEWAHPELSGEDASNAYTEWMHGGAEPEWETWKAYCRDDVIAMKYVYRELRAAEKIIDRTTLEAQQVQSDDTGPVDFSPHTDGMTQGANTSAGAGENMSLDAFTSDTPAESHRDSESEL